MILFPKAYDVWLYFREPANFIKFYFDIMNHPTNLLIGITKQIRDKI